MSKPERYKGLKPNPHTLGVERLAGDERTEVYRVTAPAWVHDLLAAQQGKSKARAIGKLLAENLDDTTSNQ